jgi:hypothetical protein
MSSQPAYEERVSSPRTIALFVLLSLLFLAGFVWRYLRVRPDGWNALLLGISALFLFYSFNYQTLVIRIADKALNLRFGLFRWAIPLTNIEDCLLDETSLWRIGGAGIHFTFLGGRYRAMFNFLEHPRLVVSLKRRHGPVRDVAFSTRNPIEVKRLLDGSLEAGH